MKTLLLLIAIAAGGYYVYNEHFSVAAITVDSYQAAEEGRGHKRKP
ncbi:hypothetical protein OMD46_06410 [Pseudomonas sp. MDMC_285]|nr:hypothetical protein [Pseudomonas sp. MDMC_285]